MQGRAQILAADTASYLVGKDLDAFAKRQRWQAAEEPGTGEIVFNPDSYLAVRDQLRVGDYALTDDEKVEYARVASRVRRQLRERAEALTHGASGADGDLAQAEVQMEVDLSRRYDKAKRSPERSLRHLSRPSLLVPARGKKLARHQLSAADIQQIVDQVAVRKWSYAEVAVQMRVSRGLVARVMKAYKADPSLVEQLSRKEDRHE